MYQTPGAIDCTDDRQRLDVLAVAGRIGATHNVTSADRWAQSVILNTPGAGDSGEGG